MSRIRSRLLCSIALVVAGIAGGSGHGNAAQDDVAQVETVRIPIGLLPFDIVGLLRRGEGARRRPAVVLLPACGRSTTTLDEDWGERLSSWGYVTLTIDGLGPRGIKDCGLSTNTDVADLAYDAYRALDFLVQKGLADPRHVAVLGFGGGAVRALSATERGAIEQQARRKFRATAAFYPQCRAIKGVMTVPTLILTAGRDESADGCRKLAAGEDDDGISRQLGDGALIQLVVYPDAYLGFDAPALQTPRERFGHHLEYNEAAAEQSREALRDFLSLTIDGRDLSH